MTTSETVRRLMDYFTSTYPRRVYATRDFNAQVMADIFDPQDRATLGCALDELVADGMLELSWEIEYRITEAGAAVVCQLHRAKALRKANLVPA